MCVQLQRERTVGVPQDFRERSEVHASFQCTCGKGMTEGMDTKLANPLFPQNPVQRSGHIPAFVRSTDLCREDQIHRVPERTCLFAQFLLMLPLNIQDLFELGRQGDAAAASSGLGCADLQRCAAGIVIIE